MSTLDLGLSMDLRQKDDFYKTSKKFFRSLLLDDIISDRTRHGVDRPILTVGGLGDEEPIRKISENHDNRQSGASIRCTTLGKIH